MTRSSDSRSPSVLVGALAVASLIASTSLLSTTPALALSQLRTIPGDAGPDDAGSSGATTGAPDAPSKDDASAPSKPTAPGAIPMPDPLVNKPVAPARPGKAEGQPGKTPAAGGPTAQPPGSETREGPVEVLTDVSKIPKPVARMRELIVEAAASGDIERLRPLLGKGETATAIGDSGEETDSVAAVKSLSGDADGLEILAIMLDVLSTGFTVIDKGTPDEMYVWPYFAAKPLDSLTPPEKVDLMRLVTAGDVASMQEFGSYNFYRIGITPDGQWKFFIGGD
ncbi:hypothetical protein ASG25_02765 [Rhizobium sp. Leaf384]|uniref:hypothetical protein n=1 Tax=unclassified Rhizobium TaxID=2613769 RepID=UPI0007146132|nr:MULTISPECIES: hypothetical protein [unclassified Rhizobium]KQS80530.1 hypothetical protein ASG25_02765 [Rhizobium sp. Leaf384]KQS86581.1 hypothetical protein ASG58_17840 [Rhizobium sp. Leaf383]